jgi:hypothetical protein
LHTIQNAWRGSTKLPHSNLSFACHDRNQLTAKGEGNMSIDSENTSTPVEVYDIFYAAEGSMLNRRGSTRRPSDNNVLI